MASTSFHEQPGQRPPPIPPPSAQMMIQAAAQAAAQNAKTPESLMLYYQSMAEKCWGLNSPPGSDSSTNSQGKNVELFHVKHYTQEGGNLARLCEMITDVRNSLVP